MYKQTAHAQVITQLYNITYKMNHTLTITYVIVAPSVVERNDGEKEAGPLCSKEGQREKERQGKKRWKRQEEKEMKLNLK